MEKFKEYNGFKFGNRGTVIGRLGRELSKNRLDSKGYHRVGYWEEGKHQDIRTHQKVWDLFGDYSRNGLQINHKNGIKTDNRIENLEAITNRQNIQHAYDIGLMKGKRNLDNHKGKLSSIDVYLIKNYGKFFTDKNRPRRKAGSCRTIADIFAVHHSIIYRIEKGIKTI